MEFFHGLLYSWLSPFLFDPFCKRPKFFIIYLFIYLFVFILLLFQLNLLLFDLVTLKVKIFVLTTLLLRSSHILGHLVLFSTRRQCFAVLDFQIKMEQTCILQVCCFFLFFGIPNKENKKRCISSVVPKQFTAKPITNLSNLSYVSYWLINLWFQITFFYFYFWPCDTFCVM